MLYKLRIKSTKWTVYNRMLINDRIISELVKSKILISQIKVLFALGFPTFVKRVHANLFFNNPLNMFAFIRS